MRSHGFLLWDCIYDTGERRPAVLIAVQPQAYKFDKHQALGACMWTPRTAAKINTNHRQEPRDYIAKFRGT